MNKEYTNFYLNPKVDYVCLLQSENPIPTKQDKYAPVDLYEFQEDGTEKILKDFYVKKPGKNSIVGFSNLVKEKLIQIRKQKIMQPDLVEVIISVSVMEKRFKEVDVDNLAKCVLDSLIGIAFEDDSQVSSLICSKHVHPMKINAVMIGITKITSHS